jgi:hypothetical protein
MFPVLDKCTHDLHDVKYLIMVLMQLVGQNVHLHKVPLTRRRERTQLAPSTNASLPIRHGIVGS